ncbi:carbohydrate kinase family protein [Archaeoglobus profundus]|uniref:PfkB domain protein n=1 Tax=Archaeoglobus profundus (strain DSM 5631 / JCM 9629 / NBRC 100127 / Av18) TaxID=572546 RepID=D2RGB3_ARCPA|nr:carbohydrate kinase family protein [Archaeoglobus profundus]ADB57338.1 PfkB domain protein [Archaeoglobus profundus DSM 5631]
MDAVGFGALNLDKVFLVSEIPKAEEESYVIDLQFSAGGSSANTIVGLAKLGLKTGFIGKVGKDKEGEFLIRDLKSYGVDTGNVIVSEGRTGCAMVFVDRDGRRAILIDPAVNDTVGFDEIDLEFVNQFKLLHLSSFVCKVSWKSFEAQKRLVEIFNGIVSFDPGSVYAKFGLEKIKPIIKHTNIFMPNEIEVKLLTGLNYKEGAEFFLKWCDIVVVKRGEEGCYIASNEGCYEVPAHKVRVVDTTGAGDAFNAGFLYGLLRGKNLEECAKLGNYLASLCIQHVGARTYLKHIDKRYLPL